MNAPPQVPRREWLGEVVVGSGGVALCDVGLLLNKSVRLELSRLADLIEAIEASRDAAIEAVRVRHDVLRDAIIAAAVAREDE